MFKNKRWTFAISCPQKNPTKISTQAHNVTRVSEGISANFILLTRIDCEILLSECMLFLIVSHFTSVFSQTPPRADFCIGVAGLRPLERIASRLRALRKARALATTMSV